jgi:hypothetical protein
VGVFTRNAVRVGGAAALAVGAIFVSVATAAPLQRNAVDAKAWAHHNPLHWVSGLQPGRIDMGVDYAGAGPIRALGKGRVTMASNHDSGPVSCWGNTCWPGGGIVVYRLLAGPFAGKYVYVAERITVRVKRGQIVAAGQPIATLARDGEIEVEIVVPENRIASYKPGQPALIEAWADAGKQMQGRLREISPEADRVTRTYRVRVSLDAGDSAPRFGQTARVVFVDANSAQQNVIPLSALYEQAGKPAVWIVDAKTHQVHLAPVQVAAYREQGVLLAGGVDAARSNCDGHHKMPEFRRRR